MLIKSIILFIIVIISNIYFTKLCYLKTEKNINNNILNDISFNILPHYSKSELIVQIISIVYSISFIVLVLLNKSKFEILDKFIYQISILYIIRIISYTLTIIPPSNSNCLKDKKFIKSDSFIELIKKFLTGKLFGGCSDLLFSGHMTFLLTITIYFIKYKLVTIIPNFILWIFSGIYALLILIARSHYSIDILYSYLITILYITNY